MDDRKRDRFGRYEILAELGAAPWASSTKPAFVYLGVAVLYAATGTAFVICEYDPFVGFFRMSFSTVNLVRVGSLFPRGRHFRGASLLPLRVSLRGDPRTLLAGLETACADSSRRNASSAGCAKTSAPTAPSADRSRPRRRSSASKAGNAWSAMLCLLPVLIGLGAGLGYGLAIPPSQLHPTVWRAEYVLLDEQSGQPKGNEGKEIAAAGR